MLKLEIEEGTEINKIEEPIIRIRIPHTKYFILGEKTEKSKWNMFIWDPDTKTKDIVRKSITTKTFALFSNIVLKTPFPYAGKDQTIKVIKEFIKKTIKIKK